MRKLRDHRDVVIEMAGMVEAEEVIMVDEDMVAEETATGVVVEIATGVVVDTVVAAVDIVVEIEEIGNYLQLLNIDCYIS